MDQGRSVRGRSSMRMGFEPAIVSGRRPPMLFVRHNHPCQTSSREIVGYRIHSLTRLVNLRTFRPGQHHPGQKPFLSMPVLRFYSAFLPNRFTTGRVTSKLAYPNKRLQKRRDAYGGSKDHRQQEYRYLQKPNTIPPTNGAGRTPVPDRRQSAHATP